jgi:transglutaminase-like putative cysteine protease
MFETENRWWDPIAGGSLFLIIFLAAYSLELTYWTYDLNRITSIALLGTTAGILIGQSMYRQKFSFALVFSYAVLILIYQFIFSLSNEPIWADRIAILFGRFQTTLGQVKENVPLEDGIIFLSFMAIIFCLTSIMAGYSFTRNGKPWLPLGIIVCIFYVTQFFLSPFHRNGLTIVIFSLLVVLFFGREFYLHQNRRWTALGYQEDNETSGLITKTILTISMIFTVTAWVIPYLNNKILQVTDQEIYNSRQKYSESWEGVRNFLYPLKSQVGFGDGLFPETLSLGLSRSLEENVVFRVRIPESSSHSGRYYWKARVYAFYEGGYWRNESLEISTLNEIELNPYLVNNREMLPYTFTFKVNEEILITPQIVIDVDRDMKVGFYPVGNNDQDVIDFIDYDLIRIGEKITVLGAYYEFLFDDQSAEEYVYPEWVQSRYLNLPDDFSINIRNLAVEVTRDKKSVFDQVIAINNYLRSTYRYKDSVKIPQGEDPLEWFLFHGREGFCNYFASAEVLMLRSIGIPSRMVGGFAQGERLSDEYIYEVRKKDGHSWVEVFFPEQGWIIFEPTPSQPGIAYMRKSAAETPNDRQERSSIDDLESGKNFEREKYFEMSEEFLSKGELDKSAIWRDFLWILPFFILVLMLVSGFQFVVIREKPILLPIFIQRKLFEKEKKIPNWIRRWADYEKLSVLEKNYQVIKFISSVFGFSRNSTQTPKEFLLDLFSKIDLRNSHGLDFMEKYHQVKFGDKRILYSEEIKALYLMILKSIIDKKVSGIGKTIKFRIKLLSIH